MPNLQGKIELIKQAQVDIKDAIVNKGITPTGNISTYADAIDNIVTPNNQTKTVTSNGIVRYDTGYTGLEQVTVNVNQSVQNKTINANGSYTADSGYVGLGTVTVNVQPDVITKSITANGTYNAESDNVDGYSSVTVNVPNPIDDLIDGSITEIDTAVTSIKGSAFKDCEDLDTVILRSNTFVDLSDESIFENTPIASKTGNIYVPDELVDEYENSGSDNPSMFVSAIQIANLGENSWVALAYGNGRFVALGYNGHISTSVDGKIWTSATQNTNLGENSWVALAYGNGTFVAIGDRGKCSTSLDGVTWAEAIESSQLGFLSSIDSLAYGNGKFVTFGYNRIAISVDGLTWYSYNASSLYSQLHFSPLTFANSKFIIISEDYPNFSTSNDGRNWIEPLSNRNLGSDMDWEAITFGAGKLLALSENGYISYTKTDYNFLPISQLSS